MYVQTEYVSYVLPIILTQSAQFHYSNHPGLGNYSRNLLGLICSAVSFSNIRMLWPMNSRLLR